MLRWCTERLLIFGLGAVVGTLVGWYMPVLFCDVWQLSCWICR